MRETLRFATRQREELVDITAEVRAVVADSGVRNGLCALYALGATAAIMIQEGDDPRLREDVVNFLRDLIPPGKWIHDRIDDNGDAHLKSGLVGPSETIPIVDGELGLSTWQNVFFCEFDGPRSQRSVICTVLAGD